MKDFFPKVWAKNTGAHYAQQNAVMLFNDIYTGGKTLVKTR